MSSSCPPDSVELGVRFELAVGAANWATDGSRLATGTEGVMSDEEGSASEGEQGNSNVDTRLIPPPSAEVVGDADLTLNAFWRVLKDAGYGVW